VKIKNGKVAKFALLCFCIFVFVILTFTACNSGPENKNDNQNQNQKDLLQKTDSLFDILTGYYIEKPDSAAIISKEYEKIFIQENNHSGLIRLYSFLSELYQYRIKDDIMALDYISKAMEVFSAHPDIAFDNTYLYVNTGNLLFQYEMYPEAIAIYRETEKFTNPDNNPGILILINNNIGLSYEGMGMCDSAYFYYNKAKSIIRPDCTQSFLNLIRSNNYMISLALYCKNTDSIPAYFSQNSEYFSLVEKDIESKPTDQNNEKLTSLIYDYNNNKIISYMLSAEYSLLNKNPDKSITQYNEALKYAKINQDNFKLIELHQRISDIYLSQNNYNQAAIQIDSSLLLTPNSATDYDLFNQIYTQISEIAFKSGNTYYGDEMKIISQNYADSMTMQKLEEDIISKKIDLAVIPIQIAMRKLEYRKNEKLKDVEFQLKLSEREQQITTYRTAIFFAILLFLIILMLFLLYHNKSKKKIAEISLSVAEKEKKYINAELQNFALHISHKNNFLRDIQTSLKSLSSNSDDKEKIKDIIFKISQNLQSTNESEIIQSKTNSINESFYVKLKDRFPDLTNKDKSLCALIKMNLSSKEISSINNISERSVITARYRLRKKLKLDNDENLNVFLNEL
jgi:tetratricopeptide (TPR) repeat protein